MSESPVAAACQRVRDETQVKRTYPFNEEGIDRALAEGPEMEQAAVRLAALAPTLRDLLCGEGGALLELDKRPCGYQDDWEPIRNCGAAACSKCALLRRAAEELGGGGS